MCESRFITQTIVVPLLSKRNLNTILLKWKNKSRTWDASDRKWKEWFRLDTVLDWRAFYQKGISFSNNLVLEVWKRKKGVRIYHFSRQFHKCGFSSLTIFTSSILAKLRMYKLTTIRVAASRKKIVINQWGFFFQWPIEKKNNEGLEMGSLEITNWPNIRTWAQLLICPPNAHNYFLMSPRPHIVTPFSSWQNKINAQK